MFPFSSEKKTMGTLLQKTSNSPYKFYSKGASEIILSRCSYVLDVDGRRIPLTDAIRKEANDRISAMYVTLNYLKLIYLRANDALRTIGLAYTEVDAYTPTDTFDSDLTLIGICGIKVTLYK
jgi:magnesium-transporting ATPase (P-type)